MPTSSRPQPPLLLYDGDCNLCRSLAQWIHRHSHQYWQTESWQAYAARHSLDSSPHLLRIAVGNELLEGEQAWLYLLEQDPKLRQFHWAAARLGLARPTAKLAQRTGRWLKRLCRSCPKR
jgi:predicted DCC family thiol-disulfide oxidoreductase YuxK